MPTEGLSAEVRRIVANLRSRANAAHGKAPPSDTAILCSEAAALIEDLAARAERPAPPGGGATLEKAAVEAIALLDVAISETAFNRPDRGQVRVNIAKAQAVLDGLRAALKPESKP